MQMKAEGGRPRVCEKSGNYEDEGPQTEESGGGRGGGSEFLHGHFGSGSPWSIQEGYPGRSRRDFRGDHGGRGQSIQSEDG